MDILMANFDLYFYDKELGVCWPPHHLVGEPAFPTATTFPVVAFCVLVISLLALALIWNFGRTQWVGPRLNSGWFCRTDPNRTRLCRDIAHPTVLSLVFNIAATMFILSLLELSFAYIDCSQFQLPLEGGAIVAVQSALVAILFPLIILILQQNRRHTTYLVPMSNILIRHAYAFPVAIALPLCLGYFLVATSIAVMTVVAALSTLATIFVLYRLLEVTFSPFIKRLQEEKVLAAIVTYSTGEVAADRVAYMKATEMFKSSSGIEATLWFYEDRHMGDGIEIITVDSQQLGLVACINSVGLKKLYERLKELLASRNFRNVQEDEVAAEEGPEIKMFVTGLPGQRASMGYKLVSIIVPQGSLTESEKSKLKEKALACFRIDETSGVHEKNLRELMTDIQAVSMEAVQLNNPEYAETAIRAFLIVYESFWKVLKKYGHYDMKTASQEVSFLGFKWVPLVSIEDSIRNWIEVAIRNLKNRGLLKDILFTPFRLINRAVDFKDALGFYRFVKLSQWEYYQISRSENHSELTDTYIDWVTEFTRFNVVHTYQKAVETKEADEAGLEFLRETAKSFQMFGKDAVDTVNPDRLKRVIKGYDKAFDLYPYENLEHQIRDELRLLKRGLADLNEDKLLVRKFRAREELRQWRFEGKIGWANYILQKWEAVQEGTETWLKYQKMFQVTLEDFPRSLSAVLHIYLQYRLLGRDESWGWDSWEIERFGEKAGFVQTGRFVERVFAYLFAVASQDSKEVDLSSEKLSFDSCYTFGKDPNGIRTLIESIDKRVEGKAGINLNNNNLKMLFDRLVSGSELQDDIALSEKQLSQDVINKFLQHFEQKFKETAVLRRILGVNRVQIDSDEKIKYGLNQLVPRNMFVDEPMVHFGDPGKTYGSDLGASESEFIFNKAINTLNVSGTTEVLDEKVEDLLEAGVPNGDLVILASRDIDFDSDFRSRENFRPWYQVQNLDHREYGYAGTLTIQGIEIPIYEVFLRNEGARGQLLICDKNAIEITVKVVKGIENEIDQLGFTFLLTDPLENEELRSSLIKRKPDWLTKHPENLWEKVVGTFVGMKIVEIIEVRVVKAEHAVLLLLDKEED